MIGAGALQRAPAAVRERVAALVWEVSARLERRAAARARRIGSGLAAHVAGSGAAAIQLATTAVIELRAAFTGIVSTAGAWGAAGLSSRGALTQRRAAALAVDRPASIRHGLTARGTARRQGAAITRDT